MNNDSNPTPSVSSKEKALDDLEKRDQHFWDVVAKESGAIISVADAADALGISQYRMRRILAAGMMDIGASIPSPSGRADAVILRSKLIRYFMR